MARRGLRCQIFHAPDEARHGLAEAVQRGGCRVCGGALHRGNFRRKPRGVPDGVEAELGPGEPRPDERLSFSCAREGCRKRHTPASLRFLGRRVFASVVIVVVMALATALGGAAVARRLADEVQVSPRTRTRWRRWWREDFPASCVWRETRGRVSPPVDEARLPATLLERLCGEAPERVQRVLRLLLPLSGRMPPDTS